MSAVKDFMPIEDAKRITEKKVEPKPSLNELIKVEVPGKPSPADLLEGSAEGSKPRNKRKKAKAPVNKITGGSTLIITEKPQAAQKIASALGDYKKMSEGGVFFYQIDKDNKRIYIASAVGHLFNLDYIKGQKGWPIFDIEWVPSFRKKSSAFTKRYYNLLSQLSKKSSDFVIATDFDIEGEVIGWNILRFICKRNNAKRMKFSTLTPVELKNSFENLVPDITWGNAYAGETRHILDWLYGINLSRALMSAIKLAGSFKILSVGRVQGPALKIIVDREKEINNFKPETYWQVFANVNGVKLKHPKDIFDKKELKKFEKIKTGSASTKITEEEMLPGHPFDLTTLQREAYRVHKINPSETLAIAQKLYLDGIISYPRTSSQKIPEVINPKKIIKELSSHFPQTKLCTRKNPVEGKKSDPAHPSIYPTGMVKNLSEREEKVYNLVVRRFLSVFAENAKLSNKKIKLIGNIPEKPVFSESALKIIKKGWLEIYPVKVEESELPDINGDVKIDEISVDEKLTKPPNRYTPASLITALEKRNLGTKATRSMIVETLFDRGYIEGQGIKATSLGINLIDTLQKYSSIILDENLTRIFEEEMELLQGYEGKKEEIEKKELEMIKKAKKIIADISKEFKSHELQIGEELKKSLEELREEQASLNELLQCPKCKKGNLMIRYSKKSRRYFVGCSAYPECTNTYTLPPNSLIKRSENKCEYDGFPKLLAIRKGKRPWEFCFNPECKIEIEKREKFSKKD